MYKAGRQNHDFQIAHFLIGSCHTADAAYALLMDQQQDRYNAIMTYKSSVLRTRAKEMELNAIIDNQDTSKANKLRAEADLMDIEASMHIGQKNLSAAQDELAFIMKCIEKLQPHRRYAHLNDAQAAQAAQRDEWRLELMRRAENFLITQGTIPHDHYATMRQHPDFEKIVSPYIETVRKLLSAGKVDIVLNLHQSLGYENAVAFLGLNYEYRPALKESTQGIEFGS